MSLSNTKPPRPQLSNYAARTYTGRGDVARGVKYVDNRRYIIRNAIESSVIAKELFLTAKPSWQVAERILRMVEDYNPILRDISQDRHMVEWVYDNMRARENLRAIEERETGRAQ